MSEILAQVARVRRELDELLVDLTSIEVTLNDVDGRIDTMKVRSPYGGRGVTGYEVPVLRSTCDVAMLTAAVSAARAQTRGADDVTAQLAGIKTTIASIEGKIATLERRLPELSTDIDNAIAAFGEDKSRAEALTAEIEELIKKIHAVVDELKSRHDDVHRYHLDAVRWALDVAHAADLMAFDRAQLLQIKRLANPASPESVTTVEAVLADVSPEVDRLAVADLRREQLTEDLRHRILSEAASLVVLDATTWPNLEVARTRVEERVVEEVSGSPRELLAGPGRDVACRPPAPRRRRGGPDAAHLTGLDGGAPGSAECHRRHRRHRRRSGAVAR